MQSNEQKPMIEKRQYNTEAGFSAVELLITLFIAAAFLAAGYQVYAVITQDSGAARQQARANNVAYEYLSRHGATVPASCVASTPVDNTEITVNGLSNVRVTVRNTCDTGITSLTKVTTTVRYGSPEKEVTHVLLAAQK